MNYICPECGQEHEEWPAWAFKTPTSYYKLSDSEKETIAEISDDFCIITYPEQTDRFIRAVLFQRITDNCQTLDYGVWVSLSEKSFNDYNNRFNEHENREAVYFGYLNTIPSGHEHELHIKTNVVVSNNDKRPEVIPHKDQIHIPFVKEYYEGITTEEALKRINGWMGNAE